MPKDKKQDDKKPEHCPHCGKDCPVDADPWACPKCGWRWRSREAAPAVED